GGVLRYGGATPDRDPIRFAADDLTAYLRRVFGVEPSRRPSPWPVAEAWLHLAPAAPSERPPAALALPPDAEAVVHPDGDGVTIAATSPRALVSATYAFLEALGCRWSPYGAGDEHVPRPGE